MKRSEFFKSLAGIAVGAVVAPTIILDALAVPEDLPTYPRGVIIQTAWVAIGDEGFHIKPNGDPPMTQEEYSKHIDELQEKLMKKIDREMGKHLII